MPPESPIALASPRRLRLVAGANGSGKTTFTQALLRDHGVGLGVYVNPDDVELTLDIADRQARSREAQKRTRTQRQDCIRRGQSMTYESVMSHGSHLDFVRDAKAAGFRTYLYYIGITDPDLCVLRVRQRVEQGGHQYVAQVDGSQLCVFNDAIQETGGASWLQLHLVSKWAPTALTQTDQP